MSTPPISFSVVLEAATITPGTQGSLRTCLEHLSKQSLPPQLANEFLLMDVGNLGPQLASEIADEYPWVTVRRLPHGTRYFAAKMAGAGLCTGEVVVFCDGDNRYSPDWLEQMVRPFADRPDLNALVGQTAVEAASLRSTLFALTFFFPPFAPSTPDLVPAAFYFGNNSSFRRTFLDAWPIPTDLPLLRGNDYVHSIRLRRAGYTVWQQSRARALHDPPETWKELTYRYLARGSDRLEIARLIRQPDPGGMWDPIRKLGAGVEVLASNLGEFVSRLITLPGHYPKTLLYYPLAIPMALTLHLFTIIGIAYSLIRPGALVAAYLRYQYPESHQPPLRTDPGLAGDPGS